MDKILKELKEKGIVYGKKFAVQAIYKWNKKANSLALDSYVVCEISFENDNGRKYQDLNLIEYYKINEIILAVKDFMERENE
jgi:hypothetical protein